MENATTPLPWFAVNDEIHDRETRFVGNMRVGNTANRVARIEYPYGSFEGREANAAAIVEAINERPALLAECDALRAQVAELSTLISERDALTEALRAGVRLIGREHSAACDSGGKCRYCADEQAFSVQAHTALRKVPS
jgi:hypothetical protein